MNITLTINGIPHETAITPSETLFASLRRLGFHGVKFGDEHGLSGADTALLDSKPVNAGSMLAVQAEGPITVEAAARNAFHEAADVWASAEYRMDMAATLAKRCCERIK